MGNRETVGIATIVVGVLLVIGAIRGTWKKLFQDVVLGQSSASTTPTTPLNFVQVPTTQQSQQQSQNTVNLQTSTFSQQTAPNPNVYEVSPNVVA